MMMTIRRTAPLLVTVIVQALVAYNLTTTSAFTTSTRRFISDRRCSACTTGSTSKCETYRIATIAVGATISPYLSAERVYFDISIGDQPIGRLVFALTIPSLLPMHAENLIQLCRGDKRSIDPAAHYNGCQFDYTTDYIEDGKGRYRWSHILRGRNRNAIGRPEEPIVDPSNQLQCTNSVYGGQYYGDKYVEDTSLPAGTSGVDWGVLLTVPITGPGRGSSRFHIVRVGESPMEWRERLLLNSGVIGKLVNDEECIQTLRTMARQRVGPPTIAASGVL